jgi:two-component system, chemotaxis family, CheB/CheR fusion protein
MAAKKVARPSRKTRKLGTPERRPRRSPSRSADRTPGLRRDTAKNPANPSAADTNLPAAVGASAGGLEAFSQVLEHLHRQPDIAFIFVQHLSPQHASALPE